MNYKKFMSMTLSLALAASTLVACGQETEKKPSEEPAKEPVQEKKDDTVKTDELEGDITFWHSFTQGARMETIQAAADDFMAKHKKVHIKIDTFSWNDFYTKWTSGLASGNVPDMSTGLTAQIAEMIHAGAVIPANDLIDSIGRDKFSKATLQQTTLDGNEYAVPLYSHAQVMWIRKDLLEKHQLEVPKTWDEFAAAAKKCTEGDVYGFSVPMGTNDFMATRLLNLYVRSGGGSLLTDDLKADLTSDLAQKGISYLVDLYNTTSPKDSINFKVLDQANLYYQGKAAFDFNSGFHIGGVKKNSPDLLPYIDAYPAPAMKEGDPQMPLEASTISLAFWKNSKHPEICKAFAQTLYEKDRYIQFLQSVPVGMLPVISGISDEPAYKDNPMVKEFAHAEKVIADAVKLGTEIGFEHGPCLQAGLLVNNHIIEKMFQEIVTGAKNQVDAAKDAEAELNALFEAAGA